jgi:uncharacterized protein (TIGR02391 family)
MVCAAIATMPSPKKPLTPALSPNVLRSISDTLAETDWGLTNKELKEILAAAGVSDPTPQPPPGMYASINKRDRLFNALVARQREDGHANGVLRLVRTAMDPARYTRSPDLFESRRDALNEALAFCSLEITEAGRIRPVPRAATLSEARLRATRLRKRLEDRGAHPRLLAACVDEIRDENYFHAVLEGAKSLAERIRQQTGLRTDGHTLIDGAFQAPRGQASMLVLNTLQTDTERSRHRGLVEGLKAIMSAARNPAAHEPKILGQLTEQDAIDLLTQMIYLQRQLDHCTVTARANSTSS